MLSPELRRRISFEHLEDEFIAAVFGVNVCDDFSNKQEFIAEICDMVKDYLFDSIEESSGYKPTPKDKDAFYYYLVDNFSKYLNRLYIRFCLDEKYPIQEESKKIEVKSIPYSHINNDWDVLQKLVKNKPYILKGDLILSKNEYDGKITTLGSIIEVTGYVDLNEQSEIESLGDLTKVGGGLDIDGTSIYSLGKLTSVGGSLHIRDQDIRSLDNLKSVGFSADLRNMRHLASLGDLRTVGGYLNLQECFDLESLNNLTRVDGYLNLNYTFIESFGDLEYVGGDLYLTDCPLSKKYSENEIRQMLVVRGNIVM